MLIIVCCLQDKIYCINSFIIMYFFKFEVEQSVAGMVQPEIQYFDEYRVF